jgi:hypothetical protein
VAAICVDAQHRAGRQPKERRNGGQHFSNRPRGAISSAIWKVKDCPKYDFVRMDDEEF